jgi:integration host factor subunit beta
MTKSELIELIAGRQSQLSSKDVELAIKTMIEHMAQALAHGNRIEIRGFGSFSLHYRAPRIGRNPKTGESVGLSGKYVPHFKPGKELRDRVNRSMHESMVQTDDGPRGPGGPEGPEGPEGTAGPDSSAFGAVAPR